MKNSILLFGLSFMMLAGAAAADDLRMNTPYQCMNGSTLTVTTCGEQDGKEYCQEWIDQKGKPASRAINPRERVMADVNSCMTQASVVQAPAAVKPAPAATGKSFNPPYLREMPSVDQVKEAMTATDARETALRQIWAFYELTEIIKAMSGSREFRGFLPDEKKILGDYQVAQYYVGQSADKAFPNQKPSEDLTYHFSRWDPQFGFKGINIWQFFSEQTQAQYAQIIGADNASYAAKRAEQKRVATEALQTNSQAATQASGGGSVRNDPGTLAARRCVELGGSALECIGKALVVGVKDLGGVDTADPHGTPGVFMNGSYTNGAAPSASFGEDKITITGCGKLVPDIFPYTITKKTNQLLINVKSEPKPFAFSMSGDGKLSGPGPIELTGRIITSYTDTWMQLYKNGVAQAGGNCSGNCGYWVHTPNYAPKTEHCAVGMLAPAPAPPPDKDELLRGLTSAMNSINPQGPTGLRMGGHYVNEGGLAIQFANDSVVLDCGAAHAKEAYTVENGANEILITVKNGASPFTMTLQPNGTLTGPGSANVAGRVVTGANDNGPTFAIRNTQCALGTLVAK